MLKRMEEKKHEPFFWMQVIQDNTKDSIRDLYSTFMIMM